MRSKQIHTSALHVIKPYLSANYVGIVIMFVNQIKNTDNLKTEVAKTPFANITQIITSNCITYYRGSIV